ncbi:MAG: ribonuclease J [Streptococcaceae bacterium]|jgi:ribonuclease J|nr:ribonuclease J [Streptococcaceae bacterium]
MAKIQVAALGGVREFGKNMYLVEIDETIFVLDAGLKYPENSMLGVDFVIPEMTYLVENAERIAGVFLTHGHADSIGALPYLIAEVGDVPVFGSELTVELAKLNTRAYEDSKKFDDFHVVDEKTEIDFGQVVISFFPTTHTIPESLGIVLTTKDGSIVYTGDFRFDPAVEKGYKTDMSRLAEIGRQGVLALLAASANALATEQSASESQIYEKIYDTVDDWEGRVIAASNSGNIGRIQQLVDVAEALGRRVAFTGEDMEQIVETAQRLKKLHIADKHLLVSPKEIDKIPDQELLIIETGRMGEPLEALMKMASRHHHHVKIKDGDLVFSVTSPSVAFETKVARTTDAIYRAGGVMKTLGKDLRVSGHANGRDLQFMLDILRPKNLIPVQGEYRELKAHADLAMEVGMLPEHIFIAKRGEMVSFKDGDLQPNGTIPADNVMIDGSGVGDIGSVVLRDRKVLSEDGIFIAVITISRQKNKIVAKARVHTKGFVFIKSSRNLINEASELVNTTTAAYLEKTGPKDFDWADIKGEIRDALGKFLYDQTKRKPAVLPIVMEARAPQNTSAGNHRTKKN